MLFFPSIRCELRQEKRFLFLFIVLCYIKQYILKLLTVICCCCFCFFLDDMTSLHGLTPHHQVLSTSSRHVGYH